MSNGTQKTGRTFIGVSAVIFFSKVLGFARDIVFASFFGTTILADLFQLIFSFPGYLFASIGAPSAVNIPDLTYYINNRTHQERMNICPISCPDNTGCDYIGIIGIVFAPALTDLIAPGLSDDVTGLAILLTRIMLPTLLFVSLTYVAAGVLQVHGHFLLSASISIPFNILVIVSLFLKGDDLIMLGYVTTLGWLLQFLIQLPTLFKEKYRFHARIDFHNERTRLLYKQLLPILLGNSLLQLCLIIDRSFATHLLPGTTAALGFGSNLFVTVTSVFIVAMAIVVFPRLSQYCLDSNHEMIRSLLKGVFKTLLFILVPYLILVIFYNQELIALVYERGAFTNQSTTITALAFLGYSLGVLGYACQEIFNRVYYALKKFHIPMKASIFCIVLKVGLDLLLYNTHGIIGISISTSLVMLIYALVTGYLLRREIGSFLGMDLLNFLLQLLLPAAAMIAVILLGRWLELEGLKFLLPLCASGLLYIGVAYLTPIRSIILGLKQK